MKNSNFKNQTSNKQQTSSHGLISFDLEERTAKFGEKVVVFCLSLKVDHISKPLVNQFVRSATSIGANYAEANNASSRKDFRNKVFIAKKETQETKHWLRMLKPCFPDRAKQLKTFWQEAHELALILQTIANKVDEK